MGLKTIVTGGGGFIGSHLVDKLLEMQHDVTVVDNFSTGALQNISHCLEEITLVECDLSRNGDWIDCFRDVDWVFHLAALADVVPSIQKPDEYFRSNVDGTYNVLRASHDCGVKRFVYAASSSCYGIPNIYPTPETATIDPQYPYALTKWIGEELVLHWAKVYKLCALSLRFFNVYGPRARTTGTYGAVFGVFLAQKLAQMPFTVVGDGTQTRDFTYVSDVVNAIISVVESDKSNRVYNVGSGQTVEVNRIVELLGGDKVFIPKRPGEPDCTFADIGRITSEFDWTPRISIAEGVAKLLTQIDNWKDAPVWTPSLINDETQEWFRYMESQD